MSALDMELQKGLAEMSLLVEHEIVYAEKACPITGCTYVCAHWPRGEIEAFETVVFNTQNRRSGVPE